MARHQIGTFPVKSCGDALAPGEDVSAPALNRIALQRLEADIVGSDFDPNRLIEVAYILKYDREYLEYAPREIRHIYAASPANLALKFERLDLLEALIAKGLHASAFDSRAEYERQWEWASLLYHNRYLRSIDQHMLAQMTSIQKRIIEILTDKLEKELKIIFTGSKCDDRGHVFFKASLNTALHDAISRRSLTDVSGALDAGASLTDLRPSGNSALILLVLQRDLSFTRDLFALKSSLGQKQEIVYSLQNCAGRDNALIKACDIYWESGAEFFFDLTKTVPSFNYNAIIAFLTNYGSSQLSDIKCSAVVHKIVSRSSDIKKERIKRDGKEVARTVRTGLSEEERRALISGHLPPFIDKHDRTEVTTFWQALMSMANDGHYRWLKNTDISAVRNLTEIWNPDLTMNILPGVYCFDRGGDFIPTTGLHLFVGIFLAGGWSRELGMFLVARGANPDSPDESGQTPLDWCMTQKDHVVAAFKEDLKALLRSP